MKTIRLRKNWRLCIGACGLLWCVLASAPAAPPAGQSQTPAPPKAPPRSTYERGNRRDPFLSPINVLSTQPTGVRVAPAEPQSLLGNLELKGIMQGGAQSKGKAILNGRLVEEGQTVVFTLGGEAVEVHLVKVETDFVTVEIPGKETAKLKLQGKGAESAEPEEKGEEKP